MTQFPSTTSRFPAEPAKVNTPSWVWDAVFYQIFPDRFASSASLPKPAGLESWDSDPTTFGYKGGDLLGVAEHLAYIQDLGANALYLNPIFQSASNHRYHTHDFFQVDPLLGGNDAFDALMAACQERGIRIVLDGVFNHASRGFFQFNDVLENGEGSPWRHWFTFNEFPPNAYDPSRPPGYEAWVGLPALPKFNTGNPEVREYIMQIGEHWLRKGIDGWRLDVPNEIRTDGFWEEFRERMRAINPECYITGEIWHPAPEYLQGDRFDAVMNYPFTEAVLGFAGRGRIVKELQEGRSYDPARGFSGHDYAERVERLLELYDWNVTLAQMNLIDSHDTPRALTLMSDDVRSLELAYTLLFTYPGAPTVYYGSEIGLDGGMPDNWARKTFPWDDTARWNHEIWKHVKAVIALRHKNPILRHGSYASLASSQASYAFIRWDDVDSMLIAINSGDKADTLYSDTSVNVEPLYSVGDEAQAQLENGSLKLQLPSRSATIWRVARG